MRDHRALKHGVSNAQSSVGIRGSERIEQWQQRRAKGVGRIAEQSRDHGLDPVGSGHRDRGRKGDRIGVDAGRNEALLRPQMGSRRSAAVLYGNELPGNTCEGLLGVAPRRQLLSGGHFIGPPQRSVRGDLQHEQVLERQFQGRNEHAR